MKQAKFKIVYLVEDGVEKFRVDRQRERDERLAGEPNYTWAWEKVRTFSTYEEAAAAIKRLAVVSDGPTCIAEFDEDGNAISIHSHWRSK